MIPKIGQDCKAVVSWEHETDHEKGDPHEKADALNVIVHSAVAQRLQVRPAHPHRPALGAGGGVRRQRRHCGGLGLHLELPRRRNRPDAKGRGGGGRSPGAPLGHSLCEPQQNRQAEPPLCRGAGFPGNRLLHQCRRLRRSRVGGGFWQQKYHPCAHRGRELSLPNQGFLEPG